MAKYNLSILPAERSYDYTVVSLEPNQVTYPVCPPSRKNPTSEVFVNFSCGLKATINWTVNSDARRYVDYDRMKTLIRQLATTSSETRDALMLTPYIHARVCIPRLFMTAFATNNDTAKTPKARLRGYWVLQYGDDIYLIRFNYEGLITRFQLAEQVVDKKAPDAPIPVAEPPRRKRGRPRKNP